MDADPARLRGAYAPATWARLQAVRAEWDPDGIFDQNFDVTPLPRGALPSNVAPLVT